MLDLFSGNFNPTAAQQSEAESFQQAVNAGTQNTWGQNQNWSLPSMFGGAPAAPNAPQTAPVASTPQTWQFENGGLARDASIKAPTYDDVFTNFMGQNYLTPGKTVDPVLAATMTAGGAGGAASGLGAFLRSRGNNDFNAASNQINGGSQYDTGEMQALARNLGIDTSQFKDPQSLQAGLDAQLQDYMLIGGMSGGWNPTGDPRQASGTIYKREGGKLVPYQTQGYHAPEEGGWLAENRGILAPLAVATGGLASMYMAPAASAGGAAGASAAGGTGAAAGGTAAASGGIGSSVANALGLGSQWAALPAWGQGAITNAAMGGLSSGLQGGNILQGALMGGVSGGVGGGISSGLSGAGMSQGLASGLGNVGGRLVAGGLQGQDIGNMLQGSAMNLGTGFIGNQLGFNAPITDNSLGAILARMAAQQGGSYLASRVDPRLAGLGGQGLASLYNRYS